MESTLSLGDIFAVATVLIPRMYHGFIEDLLRFTALNCRLLALMSTLQTGWQSRQAVMH